MSRRRQRFCWRGVTRYVPVEDRRPRLSKVAAERDSRDIRGQAPRRVVERSRREAEAVGQPARLAFPRRWGSGWFDWLMLEPEAPRSGCSVTVRQQPIGRATNPAPVTGPAFNVFVLMKTP